MDGEARFYEKQGDGSLKPLEVPAWAIARSETYLWLRRRGLDINEIRLIWEGSPTL